MILILYIHYLKQDPISDKGDIGDFLFHSTLGMSEHDWRHPIQMIESICSLYTCKNQEDHSTLSRDIGNLLFGGLGHTKTCLARPR